MDFLITAAALALAAGDPFGALKWVALRRRACTRASRHRDGAARRSFGRGRARRWITLPVPGFTSILLLPAPLTID